MDKIIITVRLLYNMIFHRNKMINILMINENDIQRIINANEILILGNVDIVVQERFERLRRINKPHSPDE